MKTTATILSLAAACMTFGSYAQDTDNDYKLLFIGIDGVRSDALQQQMNGGNAPHLQSLFDEGLYTFDSWHLGVTSSGPSWSDMLTGVWENKHGVTNNNYTGSNYDDYPYFVTRVKECRPDAKAVQITSWSPMSNNVYNDGWDNKIIPPTDDACASVAVTQLADPELDVLFVHLDDVDGAGHGNGFNPSVASYMNAIAYADTKVGEILTALYARPNFSNEKWVILATTDHGGTGFTHGGNSNDERHIWWVAKGYNVPHTEITSADPGSYQFGAAPTDEAVSLSPVLADIAVTAIDHLLPSDTCWDNNAASWDLDGKSWLSSTLYVEESQTLDLFDVYPNPNNGVFDVVITLPVNDQVHLEVKDLAGKIVVQETLVNYGAYSKSKVDISSLNAGNYFITISGSAGTATRKIIKR